MTMDQPRFKKRIQKLGTQRRVGGGSVQAAERLNAEIEASIARRSQRAQRNWQIEFPPELPLNSKLEEIKQLITEHQVVVVCGETGSGKSTQLPKLCLTMGRGVAGMIAHTQPRRIAARSIAERIAAETSTVPGQEIGFKVRFQDTISEQTFVKVMTDGMLLAELEGDRALRQYDTIIIDEAHERSLNIDFLFGYLKQLLPGRPDLKIIITSATIEPEKFSRFFSKAPFIEVSGRLFPVDLHYRPISDSRDQDMDKALVQTVKEAIVTGPGDILVFLPGEREIRSLAVEIRKQRLENCEILPLYARLSIADQRRVFAPHGGRRIVLATNVAETSLTVPGIRFVIDTGLARISRYSAGRKVQRLPIEPVSQASADQRMGRCGRIASGVCYRLYGEEDYAGRPRFTDPEILRTSLASVILRMHALNLGNPAEFPFVDPPTSKQINAGYTLLQELDAVDENRKITKSGKQLARFPVDPRLGRILLAGHSADCLKEVMVIAAALSIQDPRYGNLETRELARERQQIFADKSSDFITLLNLWNHYQAKKQQLSHRKLRKYCEEIFVSNLRMREWQEVYRQLHSLAKDMRMRLNRTDAAADHIHRALLHGLLGNVGFKNDKNEYQGTRGKKLTIFPGSILAKKPPKWIVSAELVETNRLFARTVAGIRPEWIELVGKSQLKKSYSNPRWQKKRGEVVASLQLALYGLIIVTGRTVSYGPIDSQSSREIFIRSALVEGDFNTNAKFFQHNHKLVEEIEDLEHRSRRRDVLVDDEVLFQFYAELIPTSIFSAVDFEKWRKHIEHDQPDYLYFQEQDIKRETTAEWDHASYPDGILVAEQNLNLSYHFEPGHPLDGVTVEVPIHQLNQLQSNQFEWLVPGLLPEKIVSMIKALPKSIRRRCVPAPDVATHCLTKLDLTKSNLNQQLAKLLNERAGVDIDPQVWSRLDLPDHLRMRFSVVDETGAELDSGRDLQKLQSQHGDSANLAFSQSVGSEFERAGIIAWDFDELPESLEIAATGGPVIGYPGIVDEQDSVALRLFDSKDQAQQQTKQGLKRLFRLALPQQTRYLNKSLPALNKLCMLYASLGSCAELKADIVDAVEERVYFSGQDTVSSKVQFEHIKDDARKQLVEVANEVCTSLEKILVRYRSVIARLAEFDNGQSQDMVNEIKTQVERLVYRGFLCATPSRWLPHLPRFLEAIEIRLQRAQFQYQKDRVKAAEISPYWQRYRDQPGNGNVADQRDHEENPELENYRWMLEELMVSTFAQELRTSIPVSFKRLDKQLLKMR